MSAFLVEVAQQKSKIMQNWCLRRSMGRPLPKRLGIARTSFHISERAPGARLLLEFRALSARSERGLATRPGRPHDGPPMETPYPPRPFPQNTVHVEEDHRVSQGRRRRPTPLDRSSGDGQNQLRHGGQATTASPTELSSRPPAKKASRGPPKLHTAGDRGTTMCNCMPKVVPKGGVHV